MCNSCCSNHGTMRRALACALRQAEAAAQTACEAAKMAARAENQAERLACAAREAAQTAEHAARTAENAAHCAEEALARVRELIDNACCDRSYADGSGYGMQNTSGYGRDGDCDSHESGRNCCN